MPNSETSVATEMLAADEQGDVHDAEPAVAEDVDNAASKDDTGKITRTAGLPQAHRGPF